MHDLKPLVLADIMLMAACCACLDVIILVLALTLGISMAFAALVMMVWRLVITAVVCITAAVCLHVKNTQLQPTSVIAAVALAMGGIGGGAFSALLNAHPVASMVVMSVMTHAFFLGSIVAT